MTHTELAMTRTWAEIDLDALEHNFHVLKGLLRPGCRFLGVVKADAYGHGAVPVARKLQECGADMLAVACVPEAVELRENGIELPILCLGQSAPKLAPLLWEHDIIQTVGDLWSGLMLSKAAAEAKKSIRIHVKLDTGMGRLGFYWPKEPEGQEKAAGVIESLCRLPGLKVEGLFTHLANADGSQEYTKAQLRRFDEAEEALSKLNITFQVRHCAASAGILNYPESHRDMVRFGLALYGYASTETGNADSALGLKPIMTLKSRISAVRRLPAGTCVSYGCTATLKRDSVLAVLPVGYADGYPRQMSNIAAVRVHDKFAPIVGRVCMDMMMVDVTDIPGVRAGDTAVALDGALIPRVAQRSGTIVHEILTQISPRVTRLYLGDPAPAEEDGTQPR